MISTIKKLITIIGFISCSTDRTNMKTMFSKIDYGNLEKKKNQFKKKKQGAYKKGGNSLSIGGSYLAPKKKIDYGNLEEIKKQKRKDQPIRNNNINNNNDTKENSYSINSESHILTIPNWKNLSKPSKAITIRPKKKQIKLMANHYRALLYKNIPNKNYTNGWSLLSYKNYLNNKNKHVRSPKQLGFGIISPKTNGKEYKTNIIRYVREGSIKIMSCVSKIGSYYIEAKIKNTTNQTIPIDFKIGQIFCQGQEGIGRIQNLSVLGDYNLKDWKDNKKYFEEKSLIKYVFQPNETKIISLECASVDPKCQTAHNAPINLTEYVDLCTLMCKGDQSAIFESRQKLDNGKGDTYEDLFENLQEEKIDMHENEHEIIERYLGYQNEFLISGKDWIETLIKNVSDKIIIIDFSLGQIFEQPKGMGQKQNLAIFTNHLICEIKGWNEARKYFFGLKKFILRPGEEKLISIGLARCLLSYLNDYCCLNTITNGLLISLGGWRNREGIIEAREGRIYNNLFNDKIIDYTIDYEEI